MRDGEQPRPLDTVYCPICPDCVDSIKVRNPNIKYPYGLYVAGFKSINDILELKGCIVKYKGNTYLLDNNFLMLDVINLKKNTLLKREYTVTNDGFDGLILLPKMCRILSTYNYQMKLLPPNKERQNNRYFFAGDCNFEGDVILEE